MSVENVKAFFLKAAEDEALRAKLKALAEREEALYEDLVRIAAEAGFEFTAQDVRKAHATADRELTDDELDAVAGGKGECWGSLAMEINAERQS